MLAMRVERLRLLEGARRARGVAVVIDVFRAFSTAAYAFGRGVREIVLVAGVDEAFAIHAQWPDALLMGEHENGRRVPGFDFGNATTAIAHADLAGRRLVQRTSAGTQGVIAATGADAIVLGSFVGAGALVRAVTSVAPPLVSLVAMGTCGEQPAFEDEACAELLEARLTGRPLDEAALLRSVAASDAGARFEEDSPDLPRADAAYCLRLDVFDFVMRVDRRDGLLVATPHRVP